MWPLSQVHKCMAPGSGWGLGLTGAWTLQLRAKAEELLTNSLHILDSGHEKEPGGSLGLRMSR